MPRTAGLLVVAAALTVSGCGHSTIARRGPVADAPVQGATYATSPSPGAATGDAPPPSAVSASAVAKGASPPAATTSAPAVDADRQLPTPFGAPTDDTASHTAAVTAARTAMTAFTHTALPYARWYAGLAPLLSVTAAQAYAGTDPGNIPAHSVGPAVYVRDPSATAYLARVAVSTNVGTYTVLLSREGAGTPWLVERFTPPVGVGK